jgi:membrane-associated phospholipid phosphatase
MSSTNRRDFFSTLAAWTGTAAAAASSTTIAGAQDPVAVGPNTDRVRRAMAVRTRLAEHYQSLGEVAHPTNGDEERYPNKINSFHKMLLHRPNGEVSLDAYRSLHRAVQSGKFADFELIIRGGQGRFKNPSGAYNFALLGADPSQYSMPAAPRMDSAWQAGEMVEVYWQALTRDVPFAEYETNTVISSACQELSRLSDFRGPKASGRVTPATVFRGLTPGDLNGPYVSQFLWQPFLMGHLDIEQRQRSLVPGVDFLKDWSEWLGIQLGEGKGPGNTLENTARYVRNGRDLAHLVHVDSSFSPYYHALWKILGYGPMAYTENNPWVWSKAQEPYINFGTPDGFDFVARAAKPAFNAAWFQKWFVHHRARPEVFGGRIYQHTIKNEIYPIHSEVLDSAALGSVFQKFNTYLLPQAYSEGSPAHSAYPSGHATVAGACVTMLKAFFREDYVIPNPMVASADGMRLDKYNGPDLTIGGELNKIAVNIAMGRNFAGIHWRTDLQEGLRLGETVAINILRDLATTLQDEFGGFKLTRFDGEPIVVSAIY